MVVIAPVLDSPGGRSTEGDPMRLKGIAVAVMAGTLALGATATAQAEPNEHANHHAFANKKPKTVKSSNRVCPRDYALVQVIELGPDAESLDVNGNQLLCWSSTLGVVDDNPR